METPQSPTPAQKFGEYKLLRELGRGGMGIVYDSLQTSLNRRVALKVLSSRLGLTDKAVARFKTEAEAAARLHHTNIVPIYATGAEDGVPYYTMELIDGCSLDQVIAQLRHRGMGQQPAALTGTTKAYSPDGAESNSPWAARAIGFEPDEADSPTDKVGSAASDNSSALSTSGSRFFDTSASMIADVADALQHAHDKGVIHRDIKPGNLLLGRDGRLSVNDFGLARMLEAPGMTSTGEFMGTPLYMSPEQIAAGRMRIDHRTDVYSLGATLYELLTFQPPFPGRNRETIISQIMTKEVKPPRRLNKRIPVDLETICLKALEKDPDRRYLTAGDFAADLRRFVNRHAITARRTGPLGRAVKWARRRPAVAGLAAVVVLVGLIAVMFAYRVHRLQAAAEKAARDARIAQGQQELEKALMEALSGRYATIERHLEEAEVLGVQPARIRLLRGLAASEMGNDDEAVKHLELAARQLPESMACKALLARAYQGSGDWDKSYDLSAEILKMTPKTPDDFLYGGWVATGWDTQRAIQWLEELAERHATPAVHYMLGRAYMVQVEFAGKPDGINRMIDMVNAAHATMPDNPFAARRRVAAHLVAADIYRLHGNDDEYAMHLRQAKEAAAEMLDRLGDQARAHQASAAVAAFEGRWDDAVKHGRAANARAASLDEQVGLVSLLVRSGRISEAMEEVQHLPAPIQPLVRVFLLPELKGVDAAIEAYEEWIARVDRKLVEGGAIAFEFFCFLGRPQEARTRAAALAKRIGRPRMDDPFRDAVRDFVVGTITAQELVSMAKSAIERAEAHYLVGILRLGEGNRRAAAAQFELVEKTGTPRWWHLGFNFSKSASIYLNRLREDPAWPSWIE